ncbi:hypothetical protein [Microbacterium sp. 77mftsu3.1]|uniref:hypothetical protein n=1 Tax=Microbacterium sp. 77mftsu3.1 TaxID=1761802 RepID=UPI00115F8090|nr:hypothetical protein [Microbacterium sp. 77mftsu3.1]
MNPDLIIQAGVFVATAVATAIAWGQAIIAGRRQEAAEEASVTAVAARDAAVLAQQKAAEALEEANEIARDALEAQRSLRPPSWGEIREIDQGIYAVANTSGRTVEVTAVKPLSRSLPIFDPGDLPIKLQHGESLTFFAIIGHNKEMTGNRVAITWRSSDNPSAVPATDERRF